MKGLVTLAVLATLATGGCYRVHLRSGQPPGDASPGYDFRWHHAFLLGVLDPQAPYDLLTICPRGWSAIDEQSDLLTVASTIGTLGIYAPHRVTIVCSTPAVDPPESRLDRVSRETYPATVSGSPPPPPAPLLPRPVE